MFVRKIMALPFVPNKHRVKILLSTLKEKLCGLDFSMPDRMYDRNRNDGAMYVASPDGILSDLLSQVDMERFRGFLDIGCGKGYVLWKAQQWGFSRVGGVEYDEKLCRVCMRNLRRLGLQDRVEVTCGDACRFQNYGDYDVFYFFNPFGEDVMRRVLREILRQCRGREIILLYFRPRYAAAIEECGCFRLIARLHDQEKGYDAHVYRGKIPEEMS